MRLFTILFSLALPIVALAAPSPTELVPRAGPTFPAYPPACYICQPDYENINSCAQAAVIFQNFSQVVLNPLASIATIECACTDTFRSAYPQCADCFLQTNQTQYLNASMEAVPAIVQGIRQICAIASTILGKPVASNGEAEGQTPIVVPSPTGGSDAAMRAADSLHFGATAALGAVGLLSLFAGIGTVWL